jgi:hypothetical protein
MIPRIECFVPARSGSWVMAALFAIAACAAHAQDVPATGRAQVSDYRAVFQECRKSDGASLLAVRHMMIDGTGMLLTVDPASLATRLERDADWSCADTDDERQKDTRYIRAVRSACAPHSGVTASSSDVIANGGLIHGSATAGSFVTGDLCPSNKPLDRPFLERLEAARSPVPLALSISGNWLVRHESDFEWLRAQERSGALRITWVDHSYHHPFAPGRRFADNFLLMAGVDMRAEILDTERLLIADGETPSVFFRFPGLISNPALMRVAGEYHLIVLGADAWLARSPRARSGAIILVHPNGNEPGGLEIFSTLLAAGKLPQPFRPIEEAP